MKARLLFAIAMSTILVNSATGQEIQRLDPAADQIVSANAKLERAVTGFNKWTEGPVWIEGNLFFAEIPSNNIVKWAPGGDSSVFLHPSGYQESEPYKGSEPGSNGMTVDAKGRLTVAGHARRNIFRLESMQSSAQITVLADSYQGKKLNSPNDLVYRSDGSLYFTDPPYGLPTQKDDDPIKELQVNGVFRIPHASSQKAGSAPDRNQLQLVIKDLGRPNGIGFSPDEKFLYVSDSGKRIWMRYAVAADGSVSDGSVFCDASADKARGGPDGLKLDKQGNLYGAGPGGVWIISPAGKHLVTIVTPERVGNLAWGDKDGKTLYITASTSIYRIRLNMEGLMPAHSSGTRK
jgi:gluconolactonase